MKICKNFDSQDFYQKGYYFVIAYSSNFYAQKVRKLSQVSDSYFAIAHAE